MSERDRIASQFEEHRSHLRGVAYRLLGSACDAEDAVQEAWLRVSRADAGNVLNLRGWLTTVVAPRAAARAGRGHGQPQHAPRAEGPPRGAARRR